MATVAKVDVPRTELPSPTVIWVKAQLMRSRVHIERVNRPLQLMHGLAYMLVAAGWAAVLMTKWDDVQALVLSPASAISGSVSVSAALIAAIVLLGSITLGVAMHTIIAEE